MSKELGRWLAGLFWWRWRYLPFQMEWAIIPTSAPRASPELLQLLTVRACQIKFQDKIDGATLPKSQNHLQSRTGIGQRNIRWNMDSSLFRKRAQAEAMGIPILCTQREVGVLLWHRRQRKNDVMVAWCHTTLDQRVGGRLDLRRPQALFH